MDESRIKNLGMTAVLQTVNTEINVQIIQLYKAQTK